MICSKRGNIEFMKKIVIVEDEAITALNMRFVIEKAGYSVVDVIDSGEAAVEKALHDDVDLMLMDIMLSGAMTGIEAVREIKKTRNIPIVYMTAHSDQSTMNEAKETMPYGYIIKPFNHVEVCYTIDLALYKFEMERRVREKSEQLEQMNRKNASTIQKLGAMNDALSAANDKLEKMNQNLIEREQQLCDLTVDLEQSKTELDAMYDISIALGEVSGMETLFERTAEALAASLGPAGTACAVHWNSQKFVSRAYRKHRHTIVFNLVAGGAVVGKVELSSAQPDVVTDAETRRFFKSVVDRLGRIIERYAALEENSALLAVLLDSQALFQIDEKMYVYPMNKAAEKIASKKMQLCRLVEDYNKTALSNAINKSVNGEFDLSLLPKNRGGVFRCRVSAPFLSHDGSLKRYFVCLKT